MKPICDLPKEDLHPDATRYPIEEPKCRCGACSSADLEPDDDIFPEPKEVPKLPSLKEVFLNSLQRLNETIAEKDVDILGLHHDICVAEERSEALLSVIRHKEALLLGKERELDLFKSGRRLDGTFL